MESVLEDLDRVVRTARRLCETAGEEPLPGADAWEQRVNGNYLNDLKRALKALPDNADVQR